MSEININPCLQECEGCVIKVEHRCLNDDFAEVLNRLANADMNLIVVPVYTPYPSKFVALMEKLLSVSYRVEGRPLKNKPTAIFYYCSVKIVDEMPIKYLWRQYLMDSGYYTPPTPNYPFLNEGNCDELNEKYNRDITACIKDFVINIP